MKIDHGAETSVPVLVSERPVKSSFFFLEIECCRDGATRSEARTPTRRPREKEEDRWIQITWRGKNRVHTMACVGGKQVGVSPRDKLLPQDIPLLLSCSTRRYYPAASPINLEDIGSPCERVPAQQRPCVFFLETYRVSLERSWWGNDSNPRSESIKLCV